MVETILVTKLTPHIIHVQLNRPKKLNAMSYQYFSHRMFLEVGTVFRAISADPDCRAVILSGSGRAFSAGADCEHYLVSDGAKLLMPEGSDPSRKGLNFTRTVESIQDSFREVEECGRPVIAVVHGVCIGGAVSLISACDMRYFAADAKVCVKEGNLGFAADVGALQWMPKIVGNGSWLRELLYTVRTADAQECLQFGFCSQVFPDLKQTLAAALHTAQQIAAQSPIATLGTKVNLNYSRDRSVPEGLGFAADWQASQLQTGDVEESKKAAEAKLTAQFPKL